MSDFDLAEETRLAMARPLRSTRLAGGSRPISDAELERYDDFEPYLLDDPGDSPEAVSRWAFEDEDRTLTDELPPGYDSRWRNF